MPNYVVETYLSRDEAREHRDREARVRAAAAELTLAGPTVRLEYVIHVPEDETSFYVFDAPSAHHSALAARGAGLDPIRVVEALTSKGMDQ